MAAVDPTEVYPNTDLERNHAMKILNAAAFAALALAASFSAPTVAQAGPACEKNIWSDECKAEMIKAVCLAGGGSEETCKGENETSRPTLGIQAQRTR